MSKTSRSNVYFRLALARDFSLYPPNGELACRQHLVNGGGSRGGARGSRPPLFLDQTEAQKAENFFWIPAPTHPPPPYLRVWMTAPPLLSEGLDLIQLTNFSHY